MGDHACDKIPIKFTTWWKSGNRIKQPNQRIYLLFVYMNGQWNCFTGSFWKQNTLKLLLADPGDRQRHAHVQPIFKKSKWNKMCRRLVIYFVFKNDWIVDMHGRAVPIENYFETAARRPRWSLSCKWWRLSQKSENIKKKFLKRLISCHAHVMEQLMTQRIMYVHLEWTQGIEALLLIKCCDWLLLSAIDPIRKPIREANQQ